MSNYKLSNRLAPSIGYLVLLLTLSVVAIVVLFSRSTRRLPHERPFKPVDLTCEQFSDYRLKAPTAYSNSLNYVLGYLKAAQDFKAVRKINLRNTEGFLFEYCYSNPNESLQAAIESLMNPKMLSQYRKGRSLKLADRSKQGNMAVRNPLSY